MLARRIIEEESAGLDQRGDRLYASGVDVGMLETTLRPDGRLEIDRCYIDAEHQRKGIGKQVIPYLFSIHPVREIEVYPGGHSEAFWLRQGPQRTEDGAFIYVRQ